MMRATNASDMSIFPTVPFLGQLTRAAIRALRSNGQSGLRADI